MEYDSLSRCLDGEMVDTRDSKSRAEERGGSSPLQGIIWRMLIQWAFPVEVFRKSGPGALLYLLRSLTISLRKVDSKSQNRLNIYSLNDPKNPSKEIIKNQSRWYPTARVVLRIQKRLPEEIDVSQPLLLSRKDFFFTRQEKVTTNSPFCLRIPVCILWAHAH